jgi:hypothetical protein
MSPPLPHHRSILGIDIEGSTGQLDSGRGRQRAAMYAMFEEALASVGVTESWRDDLLDRGDGVVALIHPVDEVPKIRLLDTVVPTLARLLAEHNARDPTSAFRLRVVVGAGEVTHDGRGPYGEALDVAFRLLEASAVKKMLMTTEDPMVLVVSEEIYGCVVRHGYEGIDANSYVRVRARKVSGRPRVGWARPVHPSSSVRQLAGAQVRSIADYRRQA